MRNFVFNPFATFLKCKITNFFVCFVEVHSDIALFQETIILKTNLKKHFKTFFKINLNWDEMSFEIKNCISCLLDYLQKNWSHLPMPQFYWFHSKTLLIKDSASENLRKFDAFSRFTIDSK